MVKRTLEVDIETYSILEKEQINGFYCFIDRIW